MGKIPQDKRGKDTQEHILHMTSNQATSNRPYTYNEKPHHNRLHMTPDITSQIPGVQDKVTNTLNKIQHQSGHGQVQE